MRQAAKPENTAVDQTPSTLQSLGLEVPGPGYIVGAVLFGLLGIGAYRWGKRNERPRTRWLGLALMLYPYAVRPTWALYAVGLGLCGAIYFLDLAE